MVENYGPDVLERWGVGYEQIAAVNPRIVMLSQTGFGHGRPPLALPGLRRDDLHVHGHDPDLGSSRAGHFDYLAEAHGVFAVLAALAARDRTGRGTHVDLAQVGDGGAVMGPMMLDYVVNGHEPGNQDPARCIGGPLPRR